MAKRLSDKQKDEIINFFKSGKTIDELSEIYDCTKLTISRNLKKNFDENEYKDLIQKSKLNNSDNISNDDINSLGNNKIFKNKTSFEKNSNENVQEEFSEITPLVEIAPLNLEIEDTVQKDLSSIPISEINFPKVVYMIVDKKIELQTKLLREYPDWQFLSQEELDRKTIEIFFDLKIAKRFCNKEQKVIKVPNTNVFKIVAPFLLAKGISRIVSTDQLIAL